MESTKPANFDLEHYIITRFNVKTAFAPQGVSAEWMDSRLKFFSQFTVPSLLAQTNQNFTWICAIDTQTSSLDRCRILEAASGFPKERFVLLDCETPFTASLIDYLKDRVKEPYLLTTRLDNDDALGKNYVSSLQAYLQSTCLNRPLSFFGFPRGYTYNVQTDALKSTYIEMNAFCSCLEAVSQDFKTVYRGNHRHLDRQGPFFELSSLPNPAAYLQVIHGGNVRNQDWRVARIISGPQVLAILQSDFGVTLD